MIGVILADSWYSLMELWKVSVDCIASVVCYVWYSLFVIHIMTFLYLLCYVLLFS